jgi:hypothetical protein
LFSKHASLTTFTASALSRFEFSESAQFTSAYRVGTAILAVITPVDGLSVIFRASFAAVALLLS